MDYRDELSAELPAPRDDDPAGLRQDIVDELTDHLACAYNRELLRGTKSEEARQRVLERFGDPAALARRLWLEAIGGKIMAQRVLIATCLVVSMVSLALAGAMWQQVNRAQGESSRAAVEAIRALSAQNARAEAGQQEMLKQLREMSEAIKSTRSYDWNPVTFKLTEESVDGPPAVGFAVHLTAQSQTGVKLSSRVSDQRGNAEFVGVPPGEYSFLVNKTWDRCSAYAQGSLIVEPGSQMKKKLVCPRIPIEDVPVRVHAAWPAELENQGLALFAAFDLEPLRHEGTAWYYQRPASWSYEDAPSLSFVEIAHRVLCGPGMSIAEVLDDRAPYQWTSQEGTKYWADLLPSALRDRTDAKAAMTWERGTYHLSKLMVLRAREPLGGVGGEGRKHFDVVAAASPRGSDPESTRMQNSPWWFWDRNTPPSDATIEELGRVSTSMSPHLFELPEDRWSEIGASFVARSGQANEWTIPLPAALIAIVRKSQEAAK